MGVPREPEFETGQILVDKERCWRALCLSLWFNENSDFYYRYVHGDKETFHLAFRKLKTPYWLVDKPIHPLPGTMCQHDFIGQRILQHRNMDKWDFLLCNGRIQGFWYEDECRGYIRQLQRLWDGAMPGDIGYRLARTRPPGSRAPRIDAVVLSNPGHGEACSRTLENLEETDWDEMPYSVEIEDGTDAEPLLGRSGRIRLLEKARSGPDYLLLLDGNLEFNRHFRHNLTRWAPVRNGVADLASVYNPGVREIACDWGSNLRLAEARPATDGTAWLVSCAALKHTLQGRPKYNNPPSVGLSRLFGRPKLPIFYHAPSLVQRVGIRVDEDGTRYRAIDFDREWKRK